MRNPWISWWWTAIVAAMLAFGGSRVHANGACSASGASGGLLNGLGFGPAVASGLLGKDAVLEPAPPCMPGEPASVPRSGPATVAGNPVDLVTGEKLDRAIDLHVHAPARGNGVPTPSIEWLFSRHYGSLGPGSDALGPGWRHGLATRLHATDGPRGERVLRIVQADGRELPFRSGVQRAGGTVRHAAVDRDDGVLDRLPGTGERRWIWRWRDGRELLFREDGRLVEIGAPGRERLVLHYDVHDRLEAVVGSAARALQFGYASAGARARLVHVTGPSGSRVAYGYDVHGRLAQVRYADGATVRYRYAEGSGARLSGVVLPDGSGSAYRYDGLGRVDYSRGAGDPEAAALRFVRRVDDDGGAGETAVIVDGVERARYRWSLVDGVPRLLEARGDGCARCPSVGVRYGYRGGRLATIATPRVTLTIAHDARGRPVSVRRSVVAHVGTEDRTPTALRIAWHDDPVVDRPVSILRPSVVPGRVHTIRFSPDAAGGLRWVERGFAPVVGMSGAGPRATGAVAVERVHPADAAVPSVDRSMLLTPPAGAVAIAPGLLRWTGPDGGDTHYWLDDFARVVASHSPDAGLSRWSRDRAGRLVREIAGDGAEARYRYDAGADARLAERVVAAPGAPSVSTRYSHGPHGLVVVEHPEQTEAYERDPRGRLVSRRVALRLASGRRATYTTRYRYDARGALAGTTLPDGSWLHYTRDALGQVVAVGRGHEAAGVDAEDEAPALQPILFDVQRNAAGLVHLRFGNGARLAVRRDGAGRPAEVCHTSAANAPGDPRCDLLHHRLSFDAAGRLVAWQRNATITRNLFDTRGRLVQSRWRAGDGDATWRQAYDPNGNRLFAQRASTASAGSPAGPDGESPAAAAQRGEGTIATRLHAGTNRASAERRLAPGDPPATGSDSASRPSRSAHGGRHAATRRPLEWDAASRRPLEWDAAGRLLRDGDRHYRWAPGGLLASIDTPRRRLAEYRYNHRGERIAKRTVRGWTHFLYDDARRPLAELDASGRIVRQYVHVADLPVAILDGTGADARIAFLHLDHRGAPELATGARGEVLWRAMLEPFGRRIDTGPERAASTGNASSREATATAGASSFVQPLRLPGQYEDDESGLHYNDHRYYDPSRGRYLSPDPLGLRAGPNPYVYAANDPLAWADPTGLLLFAFDGTGNGDPPPRRDDWSNVYKLSRSYADGRVWYMSGVGTTDARSGIRGSSADLVGALTARSRVDDMLGQLDEAVRAQPQAGAWIDVDIIGFSRGAAMGRDFANRVAQRIDDGVYRDAGACVRLRFLGLWDTVAQFGVDGSGNFGWKLAVPPSVKYTAHAVALNEHRMLFPGESILGSPASGVRIERGFVGAHADVGGSYAEGDLSDVALTWMHAQAQSAGVRMFALTPEFARVTSPLLHDSRGMVSGDREFHTRDARGVIVARPMQKVAAVDGMQWRDTGQFVRRYAEPLPDAYGEPTIVGQVDMASYAAWLDAHYAIAMGKGP